MAKKTRALRIGTRASQLALAQTGIIKEELQSALDGWKISLVKIRTAGDRDRRKPLAAIGGEGLFTAELQHALAEKRIDIAVHSLKDLPTDRPEGLSIAAIPKRKDPSDALISRENVRLNDLLEGAVIGTGSARRKAQILEIRPDLTVEGIRGNVETRIRKVREGKYDATLLAWAGLFRAGLENEIAEVLPFDIMLPAAGQGALGIEMRTDDPRLSIVTEILHHESSAIAVGVERDILAGLGGGCHVPVAVLCEVGDDESMRLRAALAGENGGGLRRAQASGPVLESDRIAQEVLERLTRTSEGD
jgi:hydroxymethylbilane synthase